MKFHELENMVYRIANAPWNNEVKFGCDCGCGGNNYTAEQWEEEGRLFDEAVRTLAAMGVELDD